MPVDALNRAASFSCWRAVLAAGPEVAAERREARSAIMPEKADRGATPWER